MMNNQQYLEAMGRLQPSSQFASMMTPSFSTSAGVMAQAAMPQNDNAAVMATSNAINNQIDTSVATGQSPRPLWRNGEKTFPYKVYDMLEFAESSGNTDICSWLPTGDSFVIHDRKLFTEFILPRFFLHKKWRSFTRQLNIWCFKRDFSVTVSDAYCHPFFKRGDVSKLCCVERAESKNLFKKDPITNKRKPPKTEGASLMSKSGGEKQSIKKGSEGSATTPTSAETTTKKRRVTSSKEEEEDVMDVASFLAGLKSNPNSSPKSSDAASAAEESPSVVVEKSVEGGALSSNNNNKISSSNGGDKMAEAIVASRMNMMPRQSIPYSDIQGAATSSIASLPQTSSIRPTTVSNVNIADGNNIMSMNNMNSQTMNNQTFPMNSFDGAFDRESLRRLSTEQLVALASRMKLREQMLRERAMSLQPVMAAPMAQVATPGAGWRDTYHEMLLQQQSRSLGGGMPSQGMLTQGMVHSLMGSKPKPSYGDVADMGQVTTGIPNISQNLGYPRAA